MEESTRTIVYGLAVVFALVYFVRRRLDPLNSIPIVGGSSWPILYYVGAVRFIRHGRDLMEEGYRKYYGSTFKVPLIDQWLVVVSGPQLVDELRRRPDEELSFQEGISELVQTQYTLGHESHPDPYHVDIIRDKLTRSLPLVLPEVIDELTLAFQDELPMVDHEWTELNVMLLMRQVVARASNRVFVGAPTCRDKEYIKVAIGFAIDVVMARTIINLFPRTLKPLIGRMTTRVSKNVKRIIPHLKPLIYEREAMRAKFGDHWPDKPNDMLQWVMDEARFRNGSIESISQRILLVNFAAIHTSSNSITHAIYHLAEHPEWLEPLREEIETIVRDEGWTKQAISGMRKLDSVLKESLRFNGITLATMMRKAQKDVVLSDGTRIPKGTFVVAAAQSTHHDDGSYPDPDVFDPFRFSKLRDGEGQGTKHQYVNTSTDYLPFGHGKHACPGRFFAANELKAILAYIILNFDLKFADGVVRPEPLFIGTSIIPGTSGKVLFRKRETSGLQRVTASV